MWTAAIGLYWFFFVSINSYTSTRTRTRVNVNAPLHSHYHGLYYQFCYFLSLDTALSSWLCHVAVSCIDWSLWRFIIRFFILWPVPCLHFDCLCRCRPATKLILLVFLRVCVDSCWLHTVTKCHITLLLCRVYYTHHKHFRLHCGIDILY